MRLPTPRTARFPTLTAALATVALTLAAAPPADTENGQLPPPASDELSERAHHLFDAITQGKPELADDFFFPRDPFLALKDVKDPGHYHANLVSAYHHDVRTLHGSRKSWEGATFKSFELGTPPRWVKPGEEWNKIGYHRTYGGKLHYAVAGRDRVVEVHTIISWDGRWYVTHLAKIKH
jgi:hypothetical protein